MLKKLFALLIVSFIKLSIFAQCAMCKAGAEQSLERGSTAANWINYAIIFLMTIPLVLIFSLYMLHKHNQKKNQNEISS
jgi:preprotein translocase subunit SecG